MNFPRDIPPNAALALKLVRILIVDDHMIIREGLKQILADRFPAAEFGMARHAKEALDLLRQSPWHIMLLDINMPGPTGLDVLGELKNVRPETRTLVLSMHPPEHFGLRVMKAGAWGYLTKNCAPEELIAAVEKIIGGGKYISPELAEGLAANLAAGDKQPIESLSDREHQVLLLLAAGKSVKEIAFELSLSIKTVSTFRSRLFKKLDVKSNADVIHYAIRNRLIE